MMMSSSSSYSLSQCLAVLFLLLGVIIPSNGQPDEEESYINSVLHCDQFNNCHRAFVFPDIHVNFVCTQDFRPSTSDVEDFTQQWPNALTRQDEATWGAFVEYVINLIPAVRQVSTGQLIGYTGRYWVHGGEGVPGWDIPPCGTNRTQGVANLPYLSVAINVTEDQDFSVPLSQYNLYVNQDSILAGIDAHLCPRSDLERVYIGLVDGQTVFDEEDYQYFYPEPEEICPHVSDDSVFEDWQGYLLLSVVIFLAVVVVLGGVAYCGGVPCRRRGGGTSKTAQPTHAVATGTAVPPAHDTSIKPDDVQSATTEEHSPDV